MSFFRKLFGLPGKALVDGPEAVANALDRVDIPGGDAVGAIGDVTEPIGGIIQDVGESVGDVVDIIDDILPW